jgi:ABC-type bacteriocin/lantibiotic exporter with double-glycine peptidase domain
MRKTVMVKVPYFEQEKSYYCGPACVQMVLAFYGVYVSQDDLAKQMRAHIERDRMRGMKIRKVLLDYGVVVKRGRVGLDRLKKHISEGLPAILNMHSYVDDPRGHFVVAIGCDESGIFVHDPWPITEYEKETGPYLHISLPVLHKIWTKKKDRCDFLIFGRVA